MIEAVVIIGSALFSAGAAWGGTRVALNGTKDRVKSLEATQMQTVDRLARIETKLDNVIEKVK